MDQPIVPPATIGMLGGGQLGRYALMAARTMGYRTMVLQSGEFCYSWRLWLEDAEGKEVAIEQPLVALAPFANPNFYRELVGSTPLYRHPVAPGDHVVVLQGQLPGQVAIETVSLDVGEQIKLHRKLKAPVPRELANR